MRQSPLEAKQQLSEFPGVWFRVAARETPGRTPPRSHADDSVYLDGAALGTGHLDDVSRARRVVDEFVASRALFVEVDPVVPVVTEDDVVPFVRED